MSFDGKIGEELRQYDSGIADRSHFVFDLSGNYQATEGLLIAIDVNRAEDSVRARRGNLSGQPTMWSSNSWSGTSSSVARTRPRTETPAACTVLGSPETSGCHQ